MDNTLSAREAQVYDLLSFEQDTPILELWDQTIAGPVGGVRDAQQRLGGTISRLNRKLSRVHVAIRPGVARASYRLYHTK